MKRFSRKALFFGLLLFLLPAVEANAGGNGRIAGMIKNVSGSPLRDAVIKIVQEVNQGQGVFYRQNRQPRLFQIHQPDARNLLSADIAPRVSTGHNNQVRS